MKKKITIITPTFNSANTILANLTSIKNQSYQNFEHIIIDNKSNDQTLDIIRKNNKKIKIISEKDKGVYDAINKGIKLAKGEIISILHSDDIYYDNQTLFSVIKEFEHDNTDIVYGDLMYVSRNNLYKVIRYWKSNEYKHDLFRKGWSPPHPSFFIKKNIHSKFGYYNIKIGNPADIQLMHNFLELKKINSKYINKTLVRMRYGGKSNNNIFEIFKQNIEILKFLNLKTPLKIINFLYFKIIERTIQFIKRH